MDSLNSTILPLYSLHTYISYKTGVHALIVTYGIPWELYLWDMEGALH